MPRPWRMRFAGAKYHLTVRGNARQKVFLADADCERFLAQLDAALAADQVLLYAYVLMPNHYHLLVETPLGNVPRFMQRLNTAYGMYFRLRHGRPGHCFQGRYGAKLVSGDEYLVRLTRYLHLNPVQGVALEKASAAERVALLNRYVWSSYRGYAGLVAAEARVDYRWLDLMGRRTRRGAQAAYREYVEQMAGATARDAVLQEALQREGYAVGDERFAEEIGAALYTARMSKAQTGDIRWPQGRAVPAERVLAAVAGEFGTTVEGLCRHGRAAGISKAVAMELCCRLSGESQRAAARRFGYGSEHGVGKQRQHLRELCGADPSLAARVAHLESRCLKI